MHLHAMLTGGRITSLSSTAAHQARQALNRISNCLSSLGTMPAEHAAAPTLQARHHNTRRTRQAGCCPYAPRHSVSCCPLREGAGPAVAVQGTPIEVNLALSQDDARGLASGKAAAASPSDNRNLYLVRSNIYVCLYRHCRQLLEAGACGCFTALD